MLVSDRQPCAWLLVIIGVSCALVIGCKDPRTEIIVVVDTDFIAPAEISTISVEASDPAEANQIARAESLQPESLPATVGLVRNEGPLGPFEVTVRGLLGDILLIERTARLSFIPERTLTLELPLLRSCQGVDCAEGETCAAEGCRSRDIDPAELIDWSGESPRLDGGTDLDAEAPTDADE